MSDKLLILANAELPSIRREELDGREYIVVPSYTLPYNVVMNGGLYPKEEIIANYMQLEGTKAPLGHPMRDGQFISADDNLAIVTSHVGAINRNVRLDEESGRVYVEKWIDRAFAETQTKGRELIERLDAVMNGLNTDPIHTSVAVYAEREPAKGQNYDWIARFKKIDHDAILLDEAGAATPDEGVGMLVNSSEAENPIESPKPPKKSFWARLIPHESKAMTEEDVQKLFDRINESVGGVLAKHMDEMRRELRGDLSRREGEIEANSQKHIAALEKKIDQLLEANQSNELKELRAAAVAAGQHELAVNNLDLATLRKIVADAGGEPAIQANAGRANGAHAMPYGGVTD